MGWTDLLGMDKSLWDGQTTLELLLLIHGMQGFHMLRAAGD